MDSNTHSPVAKKTGDKKLWQIQSITARSQFIAQQAEAYDGPLLVITNNGDNANIYRETIPFFLPDRKIVEFPSWETLPYDSFSPNPSIVSSRLKALLQLHSKPFHSSSSIVVLALPALLHKMVPPEYLLARSFALQTGQIMKPESLRNQLIDAGYQKVSHVNDPGEFSIRGSLIDFFPMALDNPVRVDFFADEISELRNFDANSQRSVETITSLEMMPASEVPLRDEEKQKEFLSQWNQRFSGESRQSSVFCDVKSGILPAGIEYYLPLYFKQLAHFFDYLPENCLLCTESGLANTAQKYWHEIEDRYENQRYQIHKPALPPEELFFRVEEAMSSLKRFPVLELTDKKTEKNQQAVTEKKIPSIHIQSRQKVPLAGFLAFCQETTEPKLLCCDSRGRLEILTDLLRDAGTGFQKIDNWQEFIEQKPNLGICVAPLIDSSWVQGKHIILTEDSLYGEHPIRQRSKERQQNNEFLIKSLVELHEGKPIVHYHHGIGIYTGLETMNLDGYAQEFVVLRYAGDDKLYVPVTDLQLISRYQGASNESIVLDKLSSDRWQKRKERAEKKARDSAIELLEIQARRDSRKGLQTAKPGENYHTFCSQFPFIETSDQRQTIEQVIEDMCSNKPMDRLVCGDVGFGKTEVAMRAAFMAVDSGRQVVLLAPTTLLVQQHYDSFLDRFSSWPMQIEMISRFRSQKEIDAAWKTLESGTTDIVIGTHALLTDKRNLSNVGLVIIDEEHRFGVRQKEHLKKIRAEVDLLALTATPIPRTLNFSLSGLRDLSVIATAPSNRLAIKTFVHNHKDHVLREAILRELMRGGQVFIVYNKVKTIENRREKIEELVPEARIGIAHGQMAKKELESTMGQFHQRQFNVLLCTTIIETGIDIPSANTIIIERADTFGLAQLHQLRGRVGRSHHQAYAYLLVPEHTTKEAKKRLEAISTTTTLGAGFTLAMHDMEIRGAGELLGEGQSGEIEKVGFTMYLSMLEQAIQSIRGGEIPKEHKILDVKIDLSLSALIPEDYLPDVHSRLVLYRRIVGTNNKKELSELKIEIIDRFGSLPQPLRNLFHITEIRSSLQKIGIESILFSDSGGQITFESNTAVNPADIITLLQKEPETYKLVAGDRLKISRKTSSDAERINVVKSILVLLTSGIGKNTRLI